MKNKNFLPVTYYDVVYKRDKDLFNFISLEINAIEGKEIEILNPDDLLYVQEYFRVTIDKVVETTKNNLKLMGVINPTELDFHIQKMYETPEFKQLLLSIEADYITLVNFELFHKKTFYISPNLADNLAQTKLDIESKFLKLPFDSCLFVFDSPKVISAFYEFQKQDINFDIDFNTPISVFAIIVPEMEHKKIIFRCWHANYQSSYSFIKRELLIKDGWNIDKTLKTDWNDVYSECGVENTISDLHKSLSKDDSTFYEDGMAFFRILVNAILYLSSNEPELIDNFSKYKELKDKKSRLSSKSKIARVEKQLSKTSKLDYVGVGENVPPITIDKSYQNQSKNNGNSAQIISKRFIVRGHWRNQPCGKNQEKRKLIWIKPYYKGAEMAELINKQYIVK